MKEDEMCARATNPGSAAEAWARPSAAAMFPTPGTETLLSVLVKAEVCTCFTSPLTLKKQLVTNY